jgi:hypothetical protein
MALKFLVTSKQKVMMQIFCFGQAPLKGLLGALFNAARTNKIVFFHKRGLH